MSDNDQRNPRRPERFSTEDQRRIIKRVLFGPLPMIGALMRRIPRTKRKVVLAAIGGTVVLISIFGSLSSQSETNSTATSDGKASTSTVTTLAAANTPSVTLDEFKSYVELNFGSTYWISYVTGISNNNGALWIETSLFKDQDALESGKNLCVAASMFIFADSAKRFDSLSIRYSSGERMILRKNLITDATSSTCDPEI